MPYTMQSLKNTDKRERQPMREDEGPHDELTTDREAPAVGPQYRHGAKMSFFAEAPPVGSICQVPGCQKSLKGLKKYYQVRWVINETLVYKSIKANLAVFHHSMQKYKVCPEHLELPAMVVEGQTIRFCQQCGRYQLLTEFDGTRRTCRVKLEQHNRRRRGYDFVPVSSDSDTKNERQTVAAPATGGPTASRPAAFIPAGIAQHTPHTVAPLTTIRAPRTRILPERTPLARSRSLELEAAAQLANLTTPLDYPGHGPFSQAGFAPLHLMSSAGLLHSGMVRPSDISPNTNQKSTNKHTKSTNNDHGMGEAYNPPGYDPHQVYLVERLPPAAETEPRGDEEEGDRNSGSGGCPKRRRTFYPTAAMGAGLGAGATRQNQQQQQQQQELTSFSIGGIQFDPVQKGVPGYAPQTFVLPPHVKVDMPQPLRLGSGSGFESGSMSGGISSMQLMNMLSPVDFLNSQNAAFNNAFLAAAAAYNPTSPRSVTHTNNAAGCISEGPDRSPLLGQIQQQPVPVLKSATAILPAVTNGESKGGIEVCPDLQMIQNTAMQLLQMISQVVDNK